MVEVEADIRRLLRGPRHQRIVDDQIPDRRREVGDEDLAEAPRNGNPGPLSPFEPFEIGGPLSARRDARRASVTKPLSVIRAPTRSSRKVRTERFGTAWASRVSQAQRGVGIGVSMGRNRRTSNPGFTGWIGPTGPKAAEMLVK